MLGFLLGLGAFGVSATLAGIDNARCMSKPVMDDVLLFGRYIERID